MSEIRKIFGSDLIHVIYPYLDLKNRFYLDCEDLILKSENGFYKQKNYLGRTPFDYFVDALFKDYVKNDISKGNVAFSRYKWIQKFTSSFPYSYSDLIHYLSHKNIRLSPDAEKMYRYFIHRGKKKISLEKFKKREKICCDMFNVVRIPYKYEYQKGQFLDICPYFG